MNCSHYWTNISIQKEPFNTEGTITSIRGIIREKNTKFADLKKELTNSVNTKFNKLSEENDKLINENNMVKKEHQIFMENTRKFRTKNNIFISGIPNEITKDKHVIAIHVER